MMRQRFAIGLCLIVFCIALMGPQNASGAEPKNKGLLISPIRQYTRLTAGKRQPGTFRVANLTDKPITANISVKHFSVTDYAYDYEFSEPKPNWLTPSQTQITLKPNENRTITYFLDPPADSPPGGYYYTLFASANLTESGVDSTVQAASLLYITVNGKLIRTNKILSSSLKRLEFGRTIPYTFTVKNTGNIHYFAYVSGQVHGLSASKEGVSATHLLMPGTTRKLSGSIKSPILPGIYRASYGFKTDTGVSTMQSKHIIFIPPWSIAALLLIIFGGIKLYRTKKSHCKN